MVNRMMFQASIQLVEVMPFQNRLFLCYSFRRAIDFPVLNHDGCHMKNEKLKMKNVSIEIIM